LRDADLSAASSRTWIEDGEKYSLVGLAIKTEGESSERRARARPLLTDTAFQMPGQWREWLGSIRADEVRGCNLFLLSKLRSMRPRIMARRSAPPPKPKSPILTVSSDLLT